MYTCQCESLERVQRSGVLLKEVAAFLVYSLTEISLHLDKIF